MPVSEPVVVLVWANCSVLPLAMLTVPRLSKGAAMVVVLPAPGLMVRVAPGSLVKVPGLLPPMMVTALVVENVP